MYKILLRFADMLPTGIALEPRVGSLILEDGIPMRYSDMPMLLLVNGWDVDLDETWTKRKKPVDITKQVHPVANYRKP